MRYTKKINNGYTTEQEGINAVVPCIGKLGKLEDIEEDLGIDLVKLLSLKECDTLYCKYKGKILIGMFSSTNFGTVEIDVEGKDICDSPKYDMDCLVFKLKDYGKTWAFTKEEIKE